MLLILPVFHNVAQFAGRNHWSLTTCAGILSLLLLSLSLLLILVLCCYYCQYYHYHHYYCYYYIYIFMYTRMYKVPYHNRVPFGGRVAKKRSDRGSPQWTVGHHL